jgi:hypothetical protein
MPFRVHESAMTVLFDDRSTMAGRDWWCGDRSGTLFFDAMGIECLDNE